MNCFSFSGGCFYIPFFILFHILLNLYSPIFVPLKMNRTILLKRIAAFLMIVLFISIHIVKAHHGHGANTANHLSSINDNVKADTDCAICQYHFVKDGALPFFQPTITPPAKLVKIYYTFSTPVNTSIGLLSSNKGPPSFS